tara:strand:+ start:506 stop:1051 length:546 start_codon:yes stop_codon:yes gene_type:complete
MSSSNVTPTIRNPYIVGTKEWARFRDPDTNMEIVSRNKIYSSKNKNNSSRRLNYADIDKNSNLIDLILNFTYNNDWVQIDGGEHDKKWINSKYYKNKIFNSGKIIELATGETHYFPLSDTFDDQVGITMRYQISNGGLSYTVIPNSWNQVSSREIRKKEKRIKKLNEQHEANKDIAFNNDD